MNTQLRGSFFVQKRKGLDISMIEEYSKCIAAKVIELINSNPARDLRLLLADNTGTESW
jgi:hypothetical protein